MSDRIQPFTRVVGAIILPFLVAAFVLLYPLADTTDRFFAWTINPPITAMLLGSAYAGGIVFFVHVVRPNRWHACATASRRCFVFATLLAVATFLHLGPLPLRHPVVHRLGHPLHHHAVPRARRGARQPRRGPRVPDEQDAALPAWVRILLAVIGLCASSTGLGCSSCRSSASPAGRGAHPAHGARLRRHPDAPREVNCGCCATPGGAPSVRSSRRSSSAWP